MSLDGGASTRALTEAGVKTFTVGDQIAVCYPISSDPYFAKATSAALKAGDITNSGKSATFTVTLVNPKEGEIDINYCYPAALATIDGNYDVNALANQDGTLASISSGLDFCIGAGRWDGTSDLPNCTLLNRFAICKFTVKDAVGTDITNTLTQLTIHETDNYSSFDYTIRPKSPAATFGSSIYVAMNLPAENNNISFNFTANSGTGNYTKTVTGKTLERGKIYPINLTMNEPSGAWNGNLANISASVLQADCQTVIVPDGTTLTGTLSGNYKITIADGATVTLNNAIINGTNDLDKQWAALTCNGNATIILADGSTNTMKGFYQDYPGIFVPSGSTLTIKGGTAGTGQLTASSNDNGAGIGGGSPIDCGDIVIQGGNITATSGHAAGIGCGGAGKCGNISISGGTIMATGGTSAAGIGSSTAANGSSDECGSITISGGTITATGGEDAAGIGSGFDSKCGAITITSGVTSVTATKGGGLAPYSIGKGEGIHASCGTITIGGTEYYNGSTWASEALENALKANTFTYPAQ